MQDPGIVLAKAELDVPKEGQKAEFRYFDENFIIKSSLSFKLFLPIIDNKNILAHSSTPPPFPKKGKNNVVGSPGDH